MNFATHSVMVVATQLIVGFELNWMDDTLTRAAVHPISVLADG